jgi:hypothetical protein
MLSRRHLVIAASFADGYMSQQPLATHPSTGNASHVTRPTNTAGMPLERKSCQYNELPASDMWLLLAALYKKPLILQQVMRHQCH